MRIHRPGRHRIGRIADARTAEVRDPIDVEPAVSTEPVAGEPLAERALRELDPEVLRDDERADIDETSGEGTPSEETASSEETPSEGVPSPSRAFRIGRRAGMLACWSVLGFAAVIVLSVTLPSALGLRDLTVLSGSMEPTIHTGDVVVEREISPLDAALGDIVSFKDPEDPSILITHRVQGISVHDGVVSFVTKGDANTGVERWKVSADGTIGKVEYHVWRLGYLLSWIRGPLGRVVLVVVPALVLGAYELVRIWRPRPRAAPGESDASDDPDDIEESEPDETPA
jgi:signal peptidase I